MEDYAGDQLRPPRGGQVRSGNEKADPFRPARNSQTSLVACARDAKGMPALQEQEGVSRPGRDKFRPPLHGKRAQPGVAVHQNQNAGLKPGARKQTRRAGGGSAALTTGAPPLPGQKHGPKSSAEQVAVFLQIGPGDRAIREHHADAEAIIGQLLTVNHFPEGLIRVQRSNAHYVTGLPGVLREYAGAVRTDVIGEGPLSIGSPTCQRR